MKKFILSAALAVVSCSAFAQFNVGSSTSTRTDLQQSLTTTHRDAALGTPISTVALGLVEQLGDGCGSVGLSGHTPRIGVVTIAATHVAAFEEDNKPHTGAVDRAKRLGGMDK